MDTMYDGDASASDPRLLPLLLSVRQAAELLNVSEKHIRDLCRDGTIRSVRVGSSWRIGRDALLEQFGIEGTRRVGEPTTGEMSADTVEIVIRIELPIALAKSIADARFVLTTSASPAK